MKLTQDIASLASEVGMNEFSRRYDVLVTLRDAWMNGKEVLINPLNGRFVTRHRECGVICPLKDPT